jgi:hypothetical protein
MHASKSPKQGSLVRRPSAQDTSELASPNWVRSELRSERPTGKAASQNSLLGGLRAAKPWVQKAPGHEPAGMCELQCDADLGDAGQRDGLGMAGSHSGTHGLSKGSMEDFEEQQGTQSEGKVAGSLGISAMLGSHRAAHATCCSTGNSKEKALLAFSEQCVLSL